MPAKAAASDRELTAMERLLALNRKTPGKPARPTEAEIRSIPLSQLTPNPDQPRRAFDDASLDELADSIRARGVIQPLLVRPLPAEADRYEIVVGERRFVAAGRAGLETVPCIVRPLDERETFILSIAENVAREDLSPLDEAAAYRRMLDAGYAAHQGEIAQLIGVHRTRVNHKLRLLELDPRIQEHLRQNPAHTLSMTHLEALARLQPGDPQFSLYLAAVEQDVSTREIQARVEALLTRDAPRPATAARSAFVLESGARVVVYPNRYVLRVPRPTEEPLDLPHIVRDLEGILVELRSRLDRA